MPLLLALLLAQASPASPAVEPPPREEAKPGESSPELLKPEGEENDDDAPARSLETTLESVAGRTGERRIELTVRARIGNISLFVGGESFASDLAPERRGAILGAAFAHGTLSFEGELRAAPQSEGMSRVLARLGVQGEVAALSLHGRDETLRGARLRAAGLALELDQPVNADLRVLLSASAWLNALQTASASKVLNPAPLSSSRNAATATRSHRVPSPAPVAAVDPWGSFGAATLDWAQRWEMSLSVKRRLGPISLSPCIGVAQPAQDGAYSARASLGLETQLGPARLSVGAAVAHLWPADLWLADAMLGITWHVGDE